MSPPDYDDCLLLNDTTLWLHTHSLSKEKQEHAGLVQSWAKEVKLSRQNPSSTPSATSAGNSSKVSRPAARSSTKKQAPSDVVDLSVGGLDDEIEVVEQAAAVMSPKKGNKRLTNSVSSVQQVVESIC